MTKFLLDCGAVQEICDQIGEFSSSMESLSSDIASYDVSGSDFDFGGAKQAILMNVQAASIKMKNTVNLINTVIDEHTSLQGRLRYEPVLPQKSVSGSAIMSTSTTTHVVSEGETLSGIANVYNTTVDSIKENNDIKNVDLIYPGESFIINQNDKLEKIDEIDHGANLNAEKNKSDVLDETNLLENVNKSETNNNINNIDKDYNTNTISQTKDYVNNSANGFSVTSGNKTYQLSQSDKEMLMAIVSAEADRNSKDDCLAVISVILNRCENPAWINDFGTNPIAQATAPNQFVVYQNGNYLEYLNGNVNDNVRTAVEDALNGIRNCEYLSFRGNHVTSFSNNMISSAGNRYG